jgi:acetyl esterase/lipase
MTHEAPLSRQQQFFNAWARYGQRPSLKYTKNPRLLRFLVNLTAPMTYKRPANMLQKQLVLTHDGASVPATACYIKHQPINGTLLYLHGGGFVIGSLPMYQHLVASLGHAAGMRGVFVDYRMAPEDPYPAAVDDAVTAYQALLADPDAGPISIAGDSAGGNLVLALLLKIKAMDLPMPRAAVALSPLVDAALSNASFTTNADTDHLLPGDWGTRCLDDYVGQSDRTDPFLSPIHGDFTGCPPVMIHYDTAEVLADDGAQIVDRLQRHGVTVETEVSTGRTHVWHLNVGRTPEADASVAAIGRFLHKHI